MIVVSGGSRILVWEGQLARGLGTAVPQRGPRESPGGVAPRRPKNVTSWG